MQVSNRNPEIGPVVDGKQEITVYDSRIGNPRSLTSTPEKVDEFITKRHRAYKKGTRRGLWGATFLTVIGAAVGGMINGLRKYVDADKTVGKLEKIPIIEMFVEELKNEQIRKVTYSGFKNGALIVGGLTAIISFLTLPKKKGAKKADKVTQRFIQDNFSDSLSLKE